MIQFSFANFLALACFTVQVSCDLSWPSFYDNTFVTSNSSTNATPARNATTNALVKAVLDLEDLQNNTVCGKSGIITQRGVFAINMGPNQQPQSSLVDCAAYCYALHSSFYKSVGVKSAELNNATVLPNGTATNTTMPEKRSSGWNETSLYVTGQLQCFCFPSSVGTLKLNNATEDPWIFYDTGCFDYAESYDGQERLKRSYKGHHHQKNHGRWF